MDVSCLDYRMTEEERAQFEQEGYLIVKNAIDEDLLGRLLEAADRVDAEERATKGLESDALLSKFRVIVEDESLLELLDNPRTFPKLWDILGWNIQHYISHLIYYPSEPKGASDLKPGGWHQDGGRPIHEMERPHPRLSLKIAFWLSDIDTEDQGGIRIIPGSHKRDTKLEREPNGDHEGAMQVRVKAGTAVFFDRRMWHSRGVNTSGQTRKVVFLGYSYRWLRGLDYNVIPDEILEKCDPIRRQLLGDGVDVKGWWQPTDADVPLKGWLLEHLGEDYVKSISEKQ